MLAVNAGKSPKYEDDDRMTNRMATARDNNSDKILHAKSTKTSHERDFVFAKEYDSKEWLAMRPDVSFDSTKSGNSKDQFNEMKSWFVNEGPSAGISASSEYAIPGTWPEDTHSKKNPEFSGKTPETSNNTLRGSFSGQEMQASTDETTILSQWMKQEKGGLEDLELRQGSNGRVIEEVGTVLRQLIDQNEKLVSKLEEIKRSREQDTWHEPEQQIDLDLALQTAETSETGDLGSFKTKAEKEAQTLLESNQHLRGELSKTQKELETNIALLWEQDYDLRDYQTKVEKLKTELMNCVSIDDMASFDVRTKTPLESMQEEQLEILEEENKNLNRRAKGLELEVQRLKGKNQPQG